MKKKVDHKLALFMRFFSEELGCKFVDGDTGEEIEIDDSDYNGSEQD